ncbi:MAG: HD-GYP domain-containing protein [Defluviitaleaceae bacterium]|nr:HD-GYP domain-containing protein [Defluviitaleaceae bacterium]MCL2238658.1 HD-GYP domain-containing protein [Defluviitaleaceae bacterium]
MSKKIDQTLEIKPGVRLGANVYTKSGDLLLEKGTILTEKNIQRIRTAGVMNRQKKAEPPPEETLPEEPPPQQTPPKEAPPATPITENKANFQAFAQSYEEKKEESVKLIQDISNGGIVDVDAIVSQTDSIMSELTDKKDLLTFLSFMEGTDDVTYGHSINVSLLCNLFGQWLALEPHELKILTVAGMLHDVGKTRIPPEIINKPGRLTDEEFAIMKTHPQLGYDILSAQNMDKEIQHAALMHHEKIDGSGYPARMASDKISSMTSIVTICDIYDAMTANRSYRKKVCPFEILDFFENKFFGELHTEYLLLFINKIAHSYKNYFVRLSNGDTGEVVHIHPQSIARPIILTSQGVVVDLASDKSLSITEVY